MCFTMACQRSKEMLKSACNQIVQRRMSAGGWCVAASAGGKETRHVANARLQQLGKPPGLSESRRGNSLSKGRKIGLKTQPLAFASLLDEKHSSLSTEFIAGSHLSEKH